MDWQHLRVLLVEDNDDHADLVFGLLEAVYRPEVEVVRVGRVGDGVERVQQERFDVLLLDQKLPDSDFWETVPRVVQAAPGVPVVVLTSLGDLDLALEAMNQGAQDYLVKSDLSADTLLRAMRYAIERKRYAAALERSNEMLRLFAHAVAHEVKAPLGAAHLHLSLARDEDDALSEAGRHSLGRAEEMIQRASTLVADLLRFGEVGGDPEFEAVDTASLVREALDELEPTILESKAAVQVGELPVVRGDASQLRQLFTNLLQNALKYREEGRPPVVRVGAEADGMMWSFSVGDNGVGMGPEDVERVFGLFQRAHDPERYPGTGLGLALCRRIVEAHGGRIWVESERGTGTTVRFLLAPAGGSVEQAAVTEPSAASERSGA